MKLKISLLLFILGAVSVFSAIYNTVQLQNEVNYVLEQQLTNILDQTIEELDNWINTKYDLLEYTKDIIDNVGINELTYQNSNNKYIKINLNRREIANLYIGLNDGKFIIGSDWKAQNGYDPRKEGWYKNALEGAQTVISDLYYDIKSEGYVVTISTPIYIEGSLVGVIGLDIPNEIINERIKDTIMDDSYYIVSLSKNGQIISHTRNEEMILDNINEHKGTIEYFLFSHNHDNYEDEEYYELPTSSFLLGGYVNRSGWNIGIISESNIWIESANKYLKWNYILNGIVVCIMLLVLGLFYKMEKKLIKTNKNLSGKVIELGAAKNEIERINEFLKDKTRLDALTGIYNRGYFDEVLEKWWEEAENERSLSLLMIDIDYFKKYNDNYGHPAGDVVLKKMCEKISDTLAKEEFFARYGGEEFVVLAKDKSADETKKMADDLLKAVENLEIKHSKSNFGKLTISIGISNIVPDNTKTISTFVKQADIGLYKAKENGRNRYEIFINRNCREC